MELPTQPFSEPPDHEDSYSLNWKPSHEEILLRLDPLLHCRSRLTAEECLKHLWLRKNIPPPPPELVTTKENLKTFVDNYNNSNVIVENGIDNKTVNTKPSLSAVDLIEASDKQFLNRDDAKCFSKLGNEQILHPVSLPDVLTNNNIIPVVNDNEPPPLVPPIVNNVSNTNDEMLNMMNANNYYSMPTPPVLDNASSMIANSPFVSNVATNINLVRNSSRIELENNNVSVPCDTAAMAAETVRPNPVVQSNSTNAVPIPVVPVAPLPFISKSLPAAAVLLDETIVGHWAILPPLSRPQQEDSDEPIIVHPPVVGTTLPPKRGSVDVGVLSPKRGSIDVENFFQKRGSIEKSTFLQKRDSKDLSASPLKRLSNDSGGLDSRRESIGNETSNSPVRLSLVSPISDIQSPSMVPQNIVSQYDKIVQPTLQQVISLPLQTQPLVKEIKTPAHSSGVHQEKTIESISGSLLKVSASKNDTSRDKTELGITPVEKTSQSKSLIPDTAQQVADSSCGSSVDVFLPQPPVVAKVIPISRVSSPSRPPPAIISPILISELNDFNSSQNIQTRPTTTPSSPLVFSTELPKTPTSPTSPSIFSPTKRESPLQKTLDEIPKLSSEILVSLSNLTSLSRASTFESMTKKTTDVKKDTNISESTKISTASNERVSSPRLVSFTEHKPSSLIGSTPSRTYSTVGSSFSRTKSEDKSAFATVSSKTYSTSSITTKRSESREETVNTRKEIKTPSIELDAQGFKPKLRSTAPWFSQKKADDEKNIEQKSTDISALLKENLGPLERSRWAREVRQISAKLVELSKDQTIRKQQEEEHQIEMNKQQTARRQKFKLSVLNRDVVFGEAREFYVSGEVPIGAHGITNIKHSNSSSTSTQSRRISPEKNARSRSNAK